VKLIILAVLLSGCSTDWLRRQAKTRPDPKPSPIFTCYHSDGRIEVMSPDQHTCDTGTWSSGGSGPSCADINLKRKRAGLPEINCFPSPTPSEP
jgi:hypothetical protein